MSSMHDELNRVCALEECCIKFVEKRFENMIEANTNECGAVVDMIKDLAEAKYYLTVTKAMEEYGEDDVQGYNARHYANGKFASSGHGHVMGYIEYPHNRMMNDKAEHYRDYKSMGYTNTDEHIKNSISNIKEIWKDADPQLKERIKQDISPLVNEMNM